jgi:predicted PurR-regulated permease PerM
MSADPGNFFTPAQRRVVGFTLTFAAGVGAVALLVAVFIALGRSIGFFSGVLWPLAVAGVLALILRPVVTILERRLKLPRLSAVILLFGVFLLAVTGLLLSILPPLFDQIIDFVMSLPAYWQDAMNYLRGHYPQWSDFARRQMSNPTIQHVVESATTEGRTMLAHALPSLRGAAGGVLGLVALSTHLAIIPVYLFFFLLSKGVGHTSLHNNLTFLKEDIRDDVVFLAREFVSIIESFFRGQLLIGFIMGVLLVIGFYIVGLKFALLFGLMIGLLNVVPYLGTIIGLAVVVPTAFFQPDGGWKLVGLVLLVKVIVQAIEGWYLTPKIMGDRTGLHPVMIIVAIFFWGTAFDGVLGMVLAIPLTAFFVTFWRLLKRSYFARPVRKS